MVCVRGDGVRYQGAIVRDDCILLLRYKPKLGEPFWMLPGGGREDETAEECVVREMHEETGLEVRVKRILLSQAAPQDRLYREWRTYLCTATAGEAKTGIEPGTQHLGSIAEVRWFDLREESLWDDVLRNDRITYPQLTRIRARLGYR